MPNFGVLCYDRGVSDQKPYTIIEAENELQAAIQVCGEPLTDGGKPGQLRAVVWPVSNPNAKKPFFLPPD